MVAQNLNVTELVIALRNIKMKQKRQPNKQSSKKTIKKCRLGIFSNTYLVGLTLWAPNPHPHCQCGSSMYLLVRNMGNKEITGKAMMTGGLGLNRDNTFRNPVFHNLKQKKKTIEPQCVMKRRH